jgi:GT2 family glycosyltransferase
MAIGNFLVFLNQDTVVGRSWLGELVTPLVSGELDAVHSSMLHPRDAEFAGIRSRRVPRSSYRYELTRFGHVESLVEPRSDETPRCRFLSGASFAIRRSVVEELGYLFDESFQTYCEDTELSLRLESQGYRVGFAPQSVVYHLGSFTTAVSRRNVWKHLILSRNRFLAFYRNSPSSAFLRLLPLLLLSHPVKVYNRARLAGQNVAAVAAFTLLGIATSFLGFLWFLAHASRSGGAEG